MKLLRGMKIFTGSGSHLNTSPSGSMSFEITSFDLLPGNKDWNCSIALTTGFISAIKTKVHREQVVSKTIQLGVTSDIPSGVCRDEFVGTNSNSESSFRMGGTEFIRYLHFQHGRTSALNCHTQSLYPPRETSTKACLRVHPCTCDQLVSSTYLFIKLERI